MNIKLSTKDIVLIGLMVAAIEVVKTLLSGIAGVELVTLFFMLFTLVIGPKMYWACMAFMALEGLLWGFGIWWLMYVYVWPLLVFVTLRMRNNTSLLVWCVICAAFGLFFGALCSIPYYFVGGPGAAIAWWVAGIPTDILHCVSNFLVCLVLFKPLLAALKKAAKAIGYEA